MSSFSDFVEYLNVHKGKTFVLMLCSEAINHSNFFNLIKDITTLHSLGVRLVIVFDAELQIRELLDKEGKNVDFCRRLDGWIERELPVLDNSLIDVYERAVGRTILQLVSRLSLRLSRLRSNPVNVVCGNFVIAQPVGVIDGVDFRSMGTIRRVDVEGIRSQLDLNSIVLISQIAASVTGESFNLLYDVLAARIALGLHADKLIAFSESNGILGDGSAHISDLKPDEIEVFYQKSSGVEKDFLSAAHMACKGGVRRSHLISYSVEGSLLQELFSRDGVGTQVAFFDSEVIRGATLADIPEILGLISPLEEKGILIRRSRKQIELDISFYNVIERDGMVIACAALYSYGIFGEMACLAVHPDYRDSARGELILEYIKKKAIESGHEILFALSTHSIHWFQERGFRLGSLDDLPDERKEKYDFKRASKILLCELKTDR